MLANLPRCVAVVLLAGTLSLPAAEPALKSPLSPAEAAKTLKLPAGYRIELVASEPQIESPVAAQFDEHGKLWVVEMRDYPNGPAPGEPPQGRIKVLEDKDGDGRYETATIFADKLLFANGLLPWKGGVVVTAAPHILYLKDTDGDGKADVREVLYEGFATENPQLRVSHPVLGLDGWIYVANGLRGGQIIRHQSAGAAAPGANKPINLSGMDFRFDLVRDRAEAITGMGQYGNAFDDWGNRFVCTNRNHLIPIVLPSKYVQRNPYLAPPEPTRDNQAAGGAAKVFPLSKNFTTASTHAGTFSAACSVTVYRGSLLPALRGHAFTCEPTGNLVHEEIIEPDGAGFSSRPAHDGKEFLASPDDWFRPVNLFHGPDGALYVVDMYRAVIEHPQFMPPELKNRPDLLLGKDRGRIWRIVPEKHERKGAPSVPGNASTEALVKLLTHGDMWQRTTAHRLLVERQDAAAVKPLQTMVRRAEQPLGRLHAAWLLQRQDALDETAVLNLLNDDHPRLREQAALFAEPHLPPEHPLQEELLRLASDPDARTRYQTALSLGAWDDDRILPPLAKIALAGVEDRWTRAAVASAVPTRAGKLIATLLKADGPASARLSLLHELAVLVGARGDAGEVADVLEALPAADASPIPLTTLNGLAEGMSRRNVQLGAFLKKLPENRQAATAQANRLLIQAATIAVDGKRETPQRVDAVRLLAHATWTDAEPVLTKLLQQDPAQEVRLAAVRALAAHPRPEAPPLLMKSWSAYTPPLRREVLEAMTRQPERITFLLDELAAGRIKSGDIDALRTRQLVNHSKPDIRERAKKLLQDNLPADRKEVLARYQAALKLKPDARKGKEVFAKNCAACHRIAGVGFEVGPSIADTLGKTPEAILLDVLNPNAAIDNNFINYTVATKSGKVLTGIIIAETASSLTLRRAEGQSDVVLRQDVEEIVSTGVSLMPEGQEKNISLQEMADLLAYLKNWRFLDP